MVSRITQKISILLTLCALFIGVTPLFSHAQLSAPGGGDIELTSSSDNPSPGQAVTYTARSFNANINSATITWTVDGKLLKKGTGITTVNIVTPELGKASTIKVSAVTTDGKILSKSTILRPSVVDMIVETDGYVHPLFKGKINPVFQNKIKVISIPHIINSAGREYAPDSLIYSWKKDGSVLESDSGFGKQSITLKGDLIPRDFTLSVTATSPTGGLRAEGSTQIRFGAPGIGFYVEDPLYGTLFNKAIVSVLRIGKSGESGIRAVPFGFNTGAGASDDALSFSWFVNGTEQTNLSSYQTLVLRVPEEGSGTSAIDLTVKNGQSILQNGKSSFNVIYSSTETSSNNSVTFP